MASSSAFDGATLFAANELSTKTVIATNFLIFMPSSIKPSRQTDDKHKVWLARWAVFALASSNFRARNHAV